MLETVKIEGFRCFRTFELKKLGRLNLLVGKNNSGKTSILEAIQILCSRTNLEPLAQVMSDRGEYFISEEQGGGREFDVRHLFNGHEIEPDMQFAIAGKNGEKQEKITVSISPTKNEKNIARKGEIPVQDNQKIDIVFDRNFDDKLQLNVNWKDGSQKEGINGILLSRNGGVLEDYIRRSTAIGLPKPSSIKTQFVTSSSLSSTEMLELFDRILLTPEEHIITESLKIIEPNLERIAPLSSQKFRNLESREGFVVRLSDSNQRVPIGSFGEGTWRMLGLALATTCAENGVLFVDEIDTGLHFTVMSKMWKLVWETAKRLNVQVFATTHNSDCWKSLASLYHQEESLRDEITIHRIEKGRESSVVFDAREIAVAAEEEIEVR